MNIKIILKIITNFIKNNFYLIILLLIFLSITRFFFNFYALSVRDYNERMLRTYNYCGGISYGFVKKITDKYLKNEKKIYILNFDLNPPSYGLFHNIKIDENKINLILLNFDIKNKDIFKKEKVNLEKYQLIEKNKNCFFYKKK
jgi:hypothetical protein